VSVALKNLVDQLSFVVESRLATSVLSVGRQFAANWLRSELGPAKVKKA
jgi:hypothetical protein